MSAHVYVFPCSVYLSVDVHVYVCFHVLCIFLLNSMSAHVYMCFHVFRSVLHLDQCVDVVRLARQPPVWRNIPPKHTASETAEIMYVITDLLRSIVFCSFKPVEVTLTLAKGKSFSFTQNSLLIMLNCIEGLGRMLCKVTPTMSV